MMSYAQHKSVKKNKKSAQKNDRDVKSPAITYDKRGRMEYHPEFHPNQGKRFSVDETVYLCKFYGIDSIKSLSLALGRTEKSLEYRIMYLKRAELFDYYKKKWDRMFERSELE